MHENRIVDCHVHLLPEKGYVENLIQAMKDSGIACAWLMAVEEPFEKSHVSGNEEVLKAVEKYPEFFRGFGYIQLGADTFGHVEELHQAGFVGLKVIYPSSRYDDKRYFRIYERAEKHGMPILFHLGAGLHRPERQGYDISIDYMRPAHLDTIARAFPGLTLIGAHFGNPWYEEAAEVARCHPNVFFDLTGSTLKKKSPEYFGELLWWRNAPPNYCGDSGPYDKILFGTDVHYRLIADVKQDHDYLVQRLDLSREETEKVFFRNALKILK
jgi:predicted TIM-barrel fold metal-dependent hydrolase